MAHLTKQPWGLFGANVSLIAGESGGHTFISGPTTVLVLRNVGVVTRTATVAAAAACKYGRLHDLSISIPADGARWPVPIGVGIDGYRFGGLCTVTFDEPEDFEVGLSELQAHQGVGSDADTPVALGSSPTVISVTDNAAAEPVFTAAGADGMRLYPNDGHTALWIKNSGPDARTVYVIAAQRCSYGFSDDEVITVGVGELWVTKDLPVGRFGFDVGITYDAATGLEFGAIRQTSYAG